MKVFDNIYWRNLNKLENGTVGPPIQGDIWTWISDTCVCFSWDLDNKLCQSWMFFCDDYLIDISIAFPPVFFRITIDNDRLYDILYKCINRV